MVVAPPGIRRSPVPADDQRRTAPPAAAVNGGSDFLVVGRPVLNAPDPLEAVERIVDEIALAAPAHVRKSER